MNKNNMANFIISDPRGRSEALWLDTLDYLVESLSKATSSKIEVGKYWCLDKPGCYDASITARVRSYSPLPGVESDYWEAALCYTGGKDGVYADAFVFPFLNGRPIISKGYLELDEELDEFRHWNFYENKFLDRGWSYPDGEGEWGWIKKPGDEYPVSVDIALETTNFCLREPIIVTICNITVPEINSKAQSWISRISLIQVNRNNESTNLFPLGNTLPRVGSQHSISIAYETIENSKFRIDLKQFDILGGWTVDEYIISVRVQNFHLPNDWSYTSDISSFFEFTISR